MKVSTTSTGTVSLNLPYTCRCSYCGTIITGEERITAEGHAFTGGYAYGSKGEMMKLAASLRANASVLYEIEYAEKRLEHYRYIVASGKLRAFLETGKEHKEDYFRVDPESNLGKFLQYGPNKTQAQAQQDKARMEQYPYRWHAFDKETAVKCPACGKSQPWCEATDGEKPGIKAIFLGLLITFILMIPFMAGLQLQGALVVLGFVPIILGIVSGIFIYKALRRKQLRKLAELPWNAGCLPRFDEAFLAQTKARYEQNKPTGLML